MLKPLQSPGRPRERRRSHVQLGYHTSARSFAAWWVGLLILHCVNFGYYAGAARGYKSIQGSITLFAQLDMLSIGIKIKQYDKLSVIHATIAAIHAAFIAIMMGSSLYARRLMFQPDFGRILRSLQRRFRSRVLSSMFAINAGSAVMDASASARVGSRSLSSVTDSFVSTGSFILSREGLLGVDSVYFDHILLLRELVETGLQSYQVYRMSQLLPRLWLIRMYVVLLVANCWIVPILHRYHRDRETTRRMLCLLCDAVLDMVSSIGVSIVIFASYVPDYTDPKGYGFPVTYWFNDEWLASMQQELQIMLVASWGDLVSRLVFAVGLLQCMEAIKDLLTPAASLKPAALVALDNKKPVSALATTSEPFNIEATEDISMSPVVPAPSNVEALDAKKSIDEMPNAVEPESNVKPIMTTDQATSSSKVHGGVEPRSPPQYESTIPTKRSESRRHGFVHFVVHVLGPGAFVLWGLVIIIVHLVAETHHSSGCKVALKPWLARKPGCSIIEINCHSLQSTGQDQLTATALETFDPERAARVTFRHCPSLAITPKFREFKNMAGLKIYNSTVVSWDGSAALTSSDHPAVRTVFLVRTNFSNGEIPQGLLSDDFPPLVADITFSVTNLRALPDDLDKKWPEGVHLSLEHADFTSIPDVVLRLRPRSVSVAGCPVTSVPAELFEIPGVRSIYLGYTRIQELPRNVTHVSRTLVYLLLQETNVSTFWPWMNGLLYIQTMLSVRLFNAYNTPYCQELEQIQAGTRRNFSATPASHLASVMDVSTPQKLAYASRVVDCTPGNPSHFPLALEDANHALR